MNNISKELPASIKPGVLHGNQLIELFDYLKAKKAALPAINVVNTSSINSILEAAKEVNSPIIVQFSQGGAQFYAGKGLDNSEYRASIAGALSGAMHVHKMAELYGVPVILHTDHAARKLLPWIDGLLDGGKAYYNAFGRPLFSSHMLDLSEEPIEDNIGTCVDYYKRMHAMGMQIEIELGVTGGEEDGVDNTDIDNSKLYTQPEEVAYAYERLSAVGDRFTVAAAFGNVHGVYKPGNVALEPKILKNTQAHIAEKFSTSVNDPVHFVFHGGSGSTPAEIEEAISYGVVKMNIDTDTQWGFWNGVNRFVTKNHDYLQTQLGNPDGDEKPNKKFYDPRAWLRAGEVSMKERVIQAYKDLNGMNLLG